MFPCFTYLWATFLSSFLVRTTFSVTNDYRISRCTQLRSTTISVQPELSSLPTVLYETDRILAVYKPAGMSHHSSVRSSMFGTHPATADDVIIDASNESTEEGVLAVIRRLQNEQQLAATVDSSTAAANLGWTSLYTGRLYGVHRLDRVTSGVLVLAKDADMARRLTAAFRHGRVVKYYTGVSTKSSQNAKRKQGWVVGGMERGRRKSWYLTRETATTARRYAKTRFFAKGLGHIRGQEQNPLEAGPKTLLLMRPYTGRTHQLRVAAKSIGLPLAGDPIYSDNVIEGSQYNRTFLHATALYIPADALYSNETGISSHDQKALMVFSPPPFGHLLFNDAEQGRLFDAAFRDLFRKGCDCVELLSMFSNSTDK